MSFTNIPLFNYDASIYSIGFLWGDGHLINYKMKKGNIYYISFINNYIDFFEIYNIIKHFKIQKDWKVYHRPEKSHYNRNYRLINSSESYDAKLYDKDIGDFLYQMDFLNKSEKPPTKILNNIPVNMHYLFWRGFIDADGCWSIKGKSVNFFSVTGPIDYDWTEFITLLNSLGIKRYKHNIINTQDGNSSNITIRNSHEISILGDYLYQDKLKYCLGRKYEIYKKIKENSLKSSPKSSRYRGVSFCKEKKKWLAKIYNNKKAYFLGRFFSEDDAYQACLKAKSDLKTSAVD